jgi:hypothetical protein
MDSGRIHARSEILVVAFIIGVGWGEKSIRNPRAGETTLEGEAEKASESE